MSKDNKTPEVKNEKINAEEEVVGTVNLADGGDGDEFVENIEKDFDDDDEFYDGGGLGGEGNWLNYIGIICFILAGVIGVWQFWLSGVDKYEEKNQFQVEQPQAQALLPSSSNVVKQESVVADTSTLVSLPVEPIEVLPQENVEQEPVSQTEEILPEVSVQMSEEDFFDNTVEEEVIFSDKLQGVQDSIQQNIGLLDQADTDEIVEEVVDENVKDETMLVKDALSNDSEFLIDEVIQEKLADTVTEKSKPVIEQIKEEQVDLVKTDPSEIIQATVEEIIEEKNPTLPVVLNQEADKELESDAIENVVPEKIDVKEQQPAAKPKPKNIILSFEDLKQLILEKPNAPEINYKLGREYEKQKDFDNAVLFLGKANQYDPFNPEYAHQLAMNLERVGNASAAISSYQKTLKLIKYRGDQYADLQEQVSKRLEVLTSGR